jgi:hypothetical protein
MDKVFGRTIVLGSNGWVGLVRYSWSVCRCRSNFNRIYLVFNTRLNLYIDCRSYVQLPRINKQLSTFCILNQKQGRHSESDFRTSLVCNLCSSNFANAYPEGKMNAIKFDKQLVINNLKNQAFSINMTIRNRDSIAARSLLEFHPVSSNHFWKRRSSPD